MGGYGGFIWPAYAVTAFAILAVSASSLRSLRIAQARLRELQHGAKHDET